MTIKKLNSASAYIDGIPMKMNRYKFGIMYGNGKFTEFVELNKVASVVTSQRNQSDRTVISVIGDIRNQSVHSTLLSAREVDSKIVFYACEPDDDGEMKAKLTLLDLSEVEIQRKPGPHSTSTIILTERFGSERAGEKDGFKVWKKIEGYGDVTAQYEAFIASKNNRP